MYICTLFASMVNDIYFIDQRIKALDALATTAKSSSSCDGHADIGGSSNTTVGGNGIIPDSSDDPLAAALCTDVIATDKKIDAALRILIRYMRSLTHISHSVPNTS